MVANVEYEESGESESELDSQPNDKGHLINIPLLLGGGEIKHMLTGHSKQSAE